ncbi:TMV resistance protein N-like [Ipomoea triloba]|uniref:TMV resistance protein N-like n=1 Tax=Ipomoea triloba TaxID=35885 RepID=UPI00125DDA46|nr:TMV resistance protein N-like [Ipomoea triloba]
MNSRGQVFLSFRSKEVGKSFGGHLSAALTNAGIPTCEFDHEQEEEDEELHIKKAIQESRMAIVVVTEDYASLERCLDELVWIMEWKRSGCEGLPFFVLPVFFSVDPSDVRKQGGSFAKAFGRYEDRVVESSSSSEWMKKVNQWRAALKQVADLGGMVSHNQAHGYESRFIKQIVKEAARKLNRKVLYVSHQHPIGIETRVKEINLWLQDGSTSVDILAVYGMGGVGKTTLAKTAYNLNNHSFDGSSFLADVRAASEQYDGLPRLQTQLLRDILGEKVKKIYNVHEGIVRIREAVNYRRVLVVLDDVEDTDQLNAVLGMREWLHPGSKVIITTRNDHLFDGSEFCDCKMYKVKSLSEKESLQLFSLHAFGKEWPPEDFKDLSRNVVFHCEGNPLALKVLGSALCGSSPEVWESALQKLKVIPQTKILEKLRISFDSLPDNDVRNIFLDIACFFVGKNKDFVVTVLDGCGLFSVDGIQVLTDRCLLTTIDAASKSKIMMHQLIQDMGREIIRKESPWEPWKRSRIWIHKDSFNVLKAKNGTEKVEALVLDMQMLRKAKVTTSSMFNVNDAERLYAGGNCENVQKRSRLNFLSQLINNNAEISHEPCFGVDAFSRMERLRILQLSHVKLSGSYALLPVNLRFLSWHGFSSKSIPDDFPLEGLVALDMRNGNLRKAWEGIRILRFLKILNFSHSHSLLTTPNFCGLPSLKRLILKDCTKLAEIHESIGDLEGLTFLNLRGCKNLRRLPTSFSNLKSLEHLVISGCSRLATTTTELGKLESLTTLHADEIAFGHQHTQWRSWLSRLKKAPYSESFVLSSLSRSLVSLSLVKCSLTDDALSTGITSLPSLHFLNLSGNLICSIPQSIIDLGVLKELWLDDCVNLQTLPELPLSLTKLKAAGCTSLQGIRNLPNLWTELFLLVMDCEKLNEVQGLFKLAPISNFDAELVKTLGYLDIEAIRDAEVELFNGLTETRSKYVVQGLYEFGIFSTYFPGSEVPRWFSYKQDVENSVTLKLASYTDTNITGLTISMLYSRCKNPQKFKFFGEGKFGGSFSFFIKVSNISSGLKWIYNPTYIGIPGPNEDLVFLCHWKFGKYLASGDDINVSVVGQSHTLRIKELGLAVNHYFFSPSKYFLLKGRSDGDDPNDVSGVLYDHLLFEDHRVIFGVSSDDDSDVDFDEFECDEEEAEEELEELLRWNSRSFGK